MNVSQSLSNGSSDDLPSVLPPPRSSFETPPNRYGSSSVKKSVLAPAARISESGKQAGPPRTPSPHLRRYSAHTDDSPSPSRLPSNRTLTRPPADALLTAGSSALFSNPQARRTSAIRDREAFLREKTIVESPKRGRPSRATESVHGNDSDEPQRRSKRFGRNETCDEGDATETDAPLMALPYPIDLTLGATASPDRPRRGPSSRPQRRSRGRSRRGSARSHPYVKRDVPRGYSSSPGADNEDPKDLRELFGETPDPSRIPPLPLENGALPVLSLGRPSLTQSVVQETPLPSPTRTTPPPVGETPLASRTRYGTEFGTSMKTRFSD